MAIKLKNVVFYYPKRQSEPVLTIPQWSVPKGEQVFLHGPSGGGKSTLLGLLSGLLKASEGSVCVLDQALDQMSSRQRDRFRANHVGYVFQQFNLIPYLNAIDNIQLACRFAQKKASTVIAEETRQLLSTLQLPERDWQSPARNLSIGQQQRVAIARALVTQPKLLIADEPTSSLDQLNRDLFMSLLMKITAQHETTLVFVSHDMSLSKHFNRIQALGDINRLKEIG